MCVAVSQSVNSQIDFTVKNFRSTASGRCLSTINRCSGEQDVAEALEEIQVRRGLRRVWEWLIAEHRDAMMATLRKTLERAYWSAIAMAVAIAGGTLDIGKPVSAVWNEQRVERCTNAANRRELMAWKFTTGDLYARGMPIDQWRREYEQE